MIVKLFRYLFRAINSHIITILDTVYLEAVVQRYSVKKTFLEISQKVAGLRPVTLLKKRFWHRCFPVKFVNFLRKHFFIEHLWWVLLFITLFALGILIISLISSKVLNNFNLFSMKNLLK